jgi:hypothetical protein
VSAAHLWTSVAAGHRSAHTAPAAARTAPHDRVRPNGSHKGTQGRVRQTVPATQTHLNTHTHYSLHTHTHTHTHQSTPHLRSRRTSVDTLHTRVPCAGFRDRGVSRTCAKHSDPYWTALRTPLDTTRPHDSTRRHAAPTCSQVAAACPSASKSRRRAPCPRLDATSTHMVSHDAALSHVCAAHHPPVGRRDAAPPSSGVGTPRLPCATRLSTHALDGSPPKPPQTHHRHHSAGAVCRLDLETAH